MPINRTLCILPLLFSASWSSPVLYHTGAKFHTSESLNVKRDSTPSSSSQLMPNDSTAVEPANSFVRRADGNATGGPSLPEGYKNIIFVDDFSTQKAGALPDASKWTFDLGTGYPGGAVNWGTQEIQTYTKDTKNIAISSSGTLTITPIRSGDQWTSSRIETSAAHDFTCPGGGKLRMEASIMIPATDPSKQMGIWPAFWSMGSSFRTNVTSWPLAGEIDMLEVANGVGTVFQTAHCGTIDGGPCNEKTGLGTSAEFPRDQFVKVSCEVDRSATGDWTSEKLVWYVNGKATQTITGKQIGDQTFWRNLAQTPKMLLLNVAVGGEFPNAKANNINTPNAQTVGGSESRMEIKYVAVYST